MSCLLGMVTPLVTRGTRRSTSRAGIEEIAGSGTVPHVVAKSECSRPRLGAERDGVARPAIAKAGRGWLTRVDRVAARA